jgi:hypothetical protein
MLYIPSPGNVQKIALKLDKSKGGIGAVDTMARMAAQLGLDGWEMVGNGAGFVSWFKRPIPSPTPQGG